MGKGKKIKFNGRAYELKRGGIYVVQSEGEMPEDALRLMRLQLDKLKKAYGITFILLNDLKLVEVPTGWHYECEQCHNMKTGKGL